MTSHPKAGGKKHLSHANLTRAEGALFTKLKDMPWLFRESKSTLILIAMLTMSLRVRNET